MAMTFYHDPSVKRRFKVAFCLGFCFLTIVFFPKHAAYGQDRKKLAEGDMSCPLNPSYGDEEYAGQTCGQYGIYEYFGDELLIIENTCSDKDLIVILGLNQLSNPRMMIPGSETGSRFSSSGLSNLRTLVGEDSILFFYEDVKEYLIPSDSFENFGKNFYHCFYNFPN